MSSFQRFFGASSAREYSSEGSARSSHSSREGTVLLALLILYAVGAILIYPLAQASVAKSKAEGNDPTALEFVGP